MSDSAFYVCLEQPTDSLWRVTFHNRPIDSLEARGHRLRTSCCALASKVEKWRRARVSSPDLVLTAACSHSVPWR